jgi:hypothetical protein
VFSSTTTIELPDDLFRRAKSDAGLRGRKLKNLVEKALCSRADHVGPPGLAELVKRASEMIDSGVRDPGSRGA